MLPQEVNVDLTSKREPRDYCLACARPAGHCVCAEIPSIDNVTDLLILQHRRERRHAFNSVKILERALHNLQVMVGYPDQLAQAELPLDHRTGLLYPDPQAPLLTDLSADQRPQRLVMLDGTWHHAKTFVRDVPSLRTLPRYRLAPTEPGRYRIRREPNSISLSTLEAAVQALSVLEPETAGLQQLLAAFDQMVNRQLAHPNQRRNWRKKKRGPRRARLPGALMARAENLLVAYGEAAPRALSGDGDIRLPLVWVARRLGTAERFCRRLRSEQSLDALFLRNLELSETAFEGAISVEQFRSEWNQFLRPTDTVAVYNTGTIQLLKNAGANCGATVVLKSVCANVDQRAHSDLESLLVAKGLISTAPTVRGRAERRLADAVTLVEHLRALDALRHSQSA